jgi:NAD(P)-dependent dehydrogenase (short-subunit alcohol dehydrogenase family)
MLDEVVRITAETTRYPVELLSPQADIEDELGIDSVKRGEIVVRLADALHLRKEDLAGLQKARTLGDVARVLGSLAHRPPAAGAEVNGRAIHETVAPMERAVGGALLDSLRAIVARVTRHPLELLQPDADLDDELGIGPGTLREVIAAVHEAYPAMAPLPAEQQTVRTLRELAQRVATRLEQPAAAPAPLPRSTERSRPSPPDTLSLAGRVAFISGSGRGLGRATALELARRGATVLLNSFHSRQEGERTLHEIRAAGGQAEHLWGSMARADHIDRIFDELEARNPRLDFFIHNASDGAFALLAEATEEQWLRSFRVNVVGLHHAALRAARLMTGGGRILTLSSVFRDGVADYFGVLGTVKAAVETLTRFLARELLPARITVNCVSFASLDGDVMELYPEALRVKRAVADISLDGRRTDNEEAARVLAMLLGPDAASLTGAVIRADRGFLVNRVLAPTKP